MENCWFILRQTHYPPPKDGARAYYRVPDLRHLNQVINGNPYPYPRGIAVYEHRRGDLKWEIESQNGVDLSVKALLPIPHAGGQRSVSRFWEFEALDVIFIQPTRAYIEDWLDDDLVKGYIDKHKNLGSWSLFMITGLTIARGARGHQKEEDRHDIHADPKVTVAAIADAGVGVGVNKTNGLVSSFKGSSDFIWSVQITKISKHFFSSDWNYETHVRGATYGLEYEKGDVEGFLSIQGVVPSQIIKSGDSIFVLPDE
ncbi:hypothetical protein V8E54_006418 [Elaphomyces granulatus]